MNADSHMQRTQPVELEPGVTLYPPGTPDLIPYRGYLYIRKTVKGKEK